MKKEFVVDIKDKCKRVFIPRGYCTVYLQNQAKDNKLDNIQISEEGDDVCIENISSDLPCQEPCDKECVNNPNEIIDAIKNTEKENTNQVPKPTNLVDTVKEEFTNKYDFMFKQMVANLPITGVKWLRPDFKKWWERLGKLVDSEKEA